MAVILVVLIYVIFALVVGNEGRDTRAGFFGTFVISLLITPLISYILLTCFEERFARQQPEEKADPSETT